LHSPGGFVQHARAWRGYRMACLALDRPGVSRVATATLASPGRAGAQAKSPITQGAKRSVWLSVMRWRNPSHRSGWRLPEFPGGPAPEGSATRHCRQSFRSCVGSPQHKMVIRCLAGERIRVPRRLQYIAPGAADEHDR
jgi:hypothetical protein